MLESGIRLGISRASDELVSVPDEELIGIRLGTSRCRAGFVIEPDDFFFASGLASSSVCPDFLIAASSLLLRPCLSTR